MTLSVVMMAVIAVIDYCGPPDINLGLMYCVPVVVAARRSMSRQQYWAVVASSIMLVYAGLIFGGPGLPHGCPRYLLWINRSLAAAALCLVGVASDHWRGSVRDGEQRMQRMLEQQ